ncbi:MAG TPA: hypothetical protein VGC13_08000 [Longimicrobium sp.]|jgi:hypothetical protein|uniref:hypothetical protein n=1 Tax=Longimicrobium sp. TaxID=2029185 RepID=UPI002ED82480
MHHRTPRALAAAAALALTLGACSDVPTTAPGRIASAGQVAHTVSPSGATLISNTVKYRDAGGKPAKGRSGSAALKAFALQGKDGVTELEIQAIPADPYQWRPGTITRAHVRALDVDSTPMFSLNRNQIDTWAHSEQFTTLMHGQFLQVQANVTGIDPHRTDVVTVVERVKRRPDIAVTLGQMAPEVPTLQPVPMHATISELNGDVGAHVDCMLLVNGMIEDFAFGVWVDAGDAVTCAFTYAFSPGTHNVQVEVGNVSPGDWDDANNRSEVMHVEAVGGPTRFSYDAHVSSSQSQSYWKDEYRWHNPVTQVRGENLSEHDEAIIEEFASMSGWIPRAVSGEFLLEVSQATGGRVVHTDSWTAWGQGCTLRSSGGVAFYLCSFGSSGWADTWFKYTRNAGSVTYHSRSYYREWDEGTGEDLYYYHDNESSEQDFGPLAGFGDDYAFHVRVTDGDVVLTADSEFPLVPYEESRDDTYCSGWTDPWDGFTSEWCSVIRQSTRGRSGSDRSDW